MATPVRAGRDQVCAFRLSNHHLTSRLPPNSLLEAAAACGIQDSPPGSAALALNARVRDVSPGDLITALETGKTLLRLRSLRAAPHVVPTRDAPVFTSALLPAGEEELRFFILGAGAALATVGMSATALVDLAAPALMAVLHGRTLGFAALTTELSEHVAAGLTSGQWAAWRSPGPYAPGQSLGEALIHFALYPLALQGLYCFAPRQGDEAAFARTDQWLGGPLPGLTPDQAQAELVRRYLRCYGPSTAQHFGKWAGVAPALAARAWARLEPELVRVDCDGWQAWLHAADFPGFTDPLPPRGVRLLPPHDPYLAARDRATLLPDTRLHSHIWRSVGNPGVVLADGRLIAMWRPQTKGQRLRLTFEPFSALDEGTRSELADEADRMAACRGAASAELVFVA